MIYFYQNDGTISQFNLSFQLTEQKQYGDLVKKILTNINNYIYSIRKIIVMIQNDEEDIKELEINVDVEFKNEIEDHEKIVKILVYERERDENGNVIPCVFVEKFLEYEIEREDELFIQAYRNVSSPRRRYSNNFTNTYTLPNYRARTISRNTRRRQNRTHNYANNETDSNASNNSTNSTDSSDSWSDDEIEPFLANANVSSETIETSEINETANINNSNNIQPPTRFYSSLFDNTNNNGNNNENDLSYSNSIQNLTVNGHSINNIPVVNTFLPSTPEINFLSQSINDVIEEISSYDDEFINNQTGEMANVLYNNILSSINSIYETASNILPPIANTSNLNNDSPLTPLLNNYLPISPRNNSNSTDLPIPYNSPDIPNLPIPPPIPPPLPPIAVSRPPGLTGRRRRNIPRPPNTPPPPRSLPPPPPPLPPRINRINLQNANSSNNTPPLLRQRRTGPGTVMMINPMFNRLTNANIDEHLPTTLSNRISNLYHSSYLNSRSYASRARAATFYDTTDSFLDSTVNMILNDNEIAKLSKVKYETIKNDDNYPKLEKCSMTLETFEDNTEILILPCKHYFTIESITTWLKNHSYKCPICRKEAGEGTPNF